VTARKVAVDGVGAETEVSMDDWVEIGVFAPADEEEELGEPLHFEKRRLRSGAQSITVTVPRKPGRAGIDPYHLLLDRDVQDNAREVLDSE